jgi:hypothetical protein
VRLHPTPALFFFVCALSSSPAQERFPGREVAKSLGVVRDSFLGYFVGLIDADAVGFADSAYLHEVLPEFQSFFSLPFEDLLRVSRTREEGGAVVSVHFRTALELPIPFRVLWDTPGTIRATESVTLRETRFAAWTAPHDGGPALLLAPLYVYDVVAGRFSIDFDLWLDLLLGMMVDDIDITRILLFLNDGTWYGALMGTGYDGQLVIGYFDFRENRILVPVPRRLRGIGPQFHEGAEG